LSKLSKLKQKAYQAGKRRDWEEAVAIYEAILEVDKNNPTLINELGDICLKISDQVRAVRHFLNAANKYRGTGLLNNAVAIYKKILRHDELNVHAHWYLAEIRSSQGLSVEGERHAIRFMELSDNQVSDVNEFFLKRCEQLLALYPASPMVLEHLLGVFRVRKMTTELARAQVLQAVLLFDQGEIDTARTAVRDLVGSTPNLKNFPEYAAWRERTGGGDVQSRTSDANEMDVDATDATSAGGDADSKVFEIAPQEEPAADAPAALAPTGPQIPAATAPGFGNIDVSETAAAGSGTPAADAVEDSEMAKDDEGCINIDVRGNTNFEDLMADLENAADTVTVEKPGGTETMADCGAAVEGEAARGDAAQENAEDEPQTVDLLAEILADDDSNLAAAEADQVTTITEEIGDQIGGGDDQSPYDLGMVYLEMGMFDLASDNFACAADLDDRTISAYEMWGISLLRDGRPTEAVEVFAKGLELSAETPDEQLGLLYHTGLAHEESGEIDLARDFFVKTHQIKNDFLDVAKRLDSLGVA